MFFLMRLAFWLFLIILLLPSTHEDNQRLISSAEKTVDDLGGFCHRNPDVCDTVRSGAASLLQKVQNGVAMVEIWLGSSETPDAGEKETDRLSSSVDTAPGGDPSSPLTVLEPRWQNNLTEADRSIPWQGPDAT